MVHRLFLALLCASVIFLPFPCSCVSGDDGDDGYEFNVYPDETKVSIVSGNLTVAVTRDWPRVIFQHSTDLFSPTFDIGFPKIHLFNDTDGDGRFSRSESSCTVYLDSNRVEWNLSAVEPQSTDALGRHVMFSMKARADAYNETLDAPPCIEDWADLTFWFCLAENSAEYVNPAGTHGVAGKTSVFVNMTVDVLNRTGLGFMAVERSIQGGGSTNMFHLLEDGPGGAVQAVLSAWVDEGLEDYEFTRPLNSTSSSTQMTDLAKEDGTVQAFYRWGSAAEVSRADAASATVNSSCFTTGTGLVLHSVLPLSNETPSFSLDSSLGIDEDGFAGSVTERVKDMGPEFIALTVAVVSLSVVAAAMMVRRRRKRTNGPGGQP